MCQAFSYARAHDYSIMPGFAFKFMSAPIDDAFSAFHRDEVGESLHWAATSATTAFTVTITADMGDLNVPKGYKHAPVYRRLSTGASQFARKSRV